MPDTLRPLDAPNRTTAPDAPSRPAAVHRPTAPDAPDAPDAPGAGAGPIEAVLFDADGVLQWPVGDWCEHIEASLPAGVTFLELLELEQEYTLTGERLFPDVVREFLSERGLSGDVDRIVAGWHRVEVWEDALALVDEVRARGVRCFVASNQQRTRLAHIRANHGFDPHFDDQFYSCELGLRKPDPAFFAAILRRIGAAPERTLFIDDVPANVEGARAAGLHAEHLPHGRGPAGLRDLLSAHGLAAAV